MSTETWNPSQSLFLPSLQVLLWASGSLAFILHLGRTLLLSTAENLLHGRHCLHDLIHALLFTKVSSTHPLDLNLKITSSGELSLTSLQFDIFLWLINVCLSYRLNSMRITKNIFLFTSLFSAPRTVLIKWVHSFNLQQSEHSSNLLILVPEQLLCASTYPSLINRGDYNLNIQLDLR